MRAVLDTNIIVLALIWGGTPFKLLELATEGYLSLYSSPALLAELREVVNREHLARRLARQQTAVEDAIRLYGELAISVTPLSTPRTVPNDIDDDQVIACALAAGVELIASGDSDLCWCCIPGKASTFSPPPRRWALWRTRWRNVETK